MCFIDLLGDKKVLFCRNHVENATLIFFLMSDLKKKGKKKREKKSGK